MNGQLVAESAVSRPPPLDDGTFPVALRAGWNTLLCEISLGQSEGRLHLSLLDAATDRLIALVDRGQWDEAMALMRDMLASRRDDPALVRLAARVLTRRAEDLVLRGELDQARATAKEARQHFEQLVALNHDHAGYATDLAEFLTNAPDEWVTLAPTRTVSEAGTTLTPQADGSYLASGVNAEEDSYELVAPVALSRVTAVRLEALPHKSLPHGGSGRSPINGNFLLGELRLAASAKDQSAWRDLAIGDSWADYAHPDHVELVEHVHDGREDTFWNTWPRNREPHSAIFELRNPVEAAAGTQLRVQMSFRDRRWRHHHLGRFRLAVTAQPGAMRGAAWANAAAQSGGDGLVRLAAVHYVRGDWEAARKVLRRVESDPTTAKGPDLMLLALVHTKLGRDEDAQAWFERALAWLGSRPIGPEMRLPVRELLVARGMNETEIEQFLAEAKQHQQR